jgi:hypothetical protein
MTNSKFNISYRKQRNGQYEEYKNAQIVGYYSSEDEGINIGYQARVPVEGGSEGETRWARFSYDGIKDMVAAQ